MYIEELGIISQTTWSVSPTSSVGLCIQTSAFDEKSAEVH